MAGCADMLRRCARCGHPWLAHEPVCVVTVYGPKRSCAQDCRKFVEPEAEAS